MQSKSLTAIVEAGAGTADRDLRILKMANPSVNVVDQEAGQFAPVPAEL